jgi:hypothetical protein
MGMNDKQLIAIRSWRLLFACLFLDKPFGFANNLVY